MQTTAIGTVANSLPQNEVIFLTILISNRYVPYTDLRKILVGDTRLPRWGQTRPSLGTHEGVVGDTREIGLFE